MRYVFRSHLGSPLRQVDRMSCEMALAQRSLLSTVDSVETHYKVAGARLTLQPHLTVDYLFQELLLIKYINEECKIF